MRYEVRREAVDLAPEFVPDRDVVEEEPGAHATAQPQKRGPRLILGIRLNENAKVAGAHIYIVNSSDAASKSPIAEIGPARKDEGWPYIKLEPHFLAGA